MREDASTERLSTDELFRRHAAFVARVLYRMGVPVAELEDLVQEVFVVVHRLGGYAPGPASPTGYLASIALKAASGARRREHKQRVRQSDHMPEQLAALSGNPVELLEQREELLQLQAALDCLPPKLRALLILVDIEGVSSSDVAASEGIPVGTVYWQLHRARSKFRDATRRVCGAPLRLRARVQGGVP